MKPVIDFSILDNKKDVNPVNGADLRPPQKALQAIQLDKVEISQGIKSGGDPYPLLLKAIQVISKLTGDQEFYTMHSAYMQENGLLDTIPKEWEVSNNGADQYSRKIADYLSVVNRFIDRNKHARTFDDFVRVGKDLGSIGGEEADPFFRSLLVAAFEELEREYINFNKGEAKSAE